MESQYLTGQCDGCGCQSVHLVAINSAPIAGGAICRECLLEGAIQKALPLLEENAATERAFYGARDKYGIARDATEIVERVKHALNPFDK